MVIAGRARGPPRYVRGQRIAFAHRLVATTDRAFTFVTKDGPLARFVRLDVVPRLLPALMQHAAVKRFFFRTVSQIEIEYHASALSAGRAGDVRGGDRLPWAPDNFAPLASLDWQAHVYGKVNGVGEACKALGLPLHSLPWNEAAERSGLERDALYLVRPDG